MTLAPHEREFLERLSESPNPLGWKPAGRDEDGVAQVSCALALPDGGTKVTVIKITEKGLVYSQRKFPPKPSGEATGVETV